LTGNDGSEDQAEGAQTDRGGTAKKMGGKEEAGRLGQLRVGICDQMDALYSFDLLTAGQFVATAIPGGMGECLVCCRILLGPSQKCLLGDDWKWTRARWPSGSEAGGEPAGSFKARVSRFLTAAEATWSQAARTA